MSSEKVVQEDRSELLQKVQLPTIYTFSSNKMIIFYFSGFDTKIYLDKPHLCQFHLKVERQPLLFSQARLRVDKYEFGSFSEHTVG